MRSRWFAATVRIRGGPVKTICAVSAFVLVAVQACACLAVEVRQNMIGIYAAPTTHHVSSGDDVEKLQSSTQLDGGVFYYRSLKENLALRVDARFARREYTAHATTDLLPAGYYPLPLSEDFIEFPLMLLATRDVAVGDAVIRISVGGGGYFATLLSQEFAVDPPSTFPDAPEPLDAGGYSRYGWLLDGGAALLVEAKTAFFLNLRIQDDAAIDDDPENAIKRKDTAFGFYAGFGWLF